MIIRSLNFLAEFADFYNFLSPVIVYYCYSKLVLHALAINCATM